MSRLCINVVAKKENNFFRRILSEIILEQEGLQLKNKHLIVQLLILKIYQPYLFKEIKGGYSNNTFLHTGENLVLRFPKIYNPIDPEVSVEVQNLNLAQLFNLTPLKTLAYYSKYNLLVTEFIPNFRLCSAVNFKNPAKLITLAQLVKKLHYSEFNFKINSETALSFTDQSSQCFQTIQSILTKKDYQTLKKLSGIKNFLSKFKCLKVPSHGDLHHLNVIEINGHLQLIDWELSSMEDPAYDISRLFCVTGFNSAQKEIFLKAYKYADNIFISEKDIKNLIKRIFLYESLNYFSVIIWSKYAMSHLHEENQQHLLKEAIINYSQKDKLICY